MCTGVALYDTGHIRPLDAFQAGKSFFEAIGIPITGATYYEHLSDGDHEGDHDIFEVSIDELQERILSEKTSSFWIYSDLRGGKPWDAAFTYQTGEFGNFAHMGAHCDIKPEEVYGALTDWLGEAAERFDVPYGIFYTADDIPDALHYAAGESCVFMFPFEDCFAFIHEAPGRYGGKGRYTESMLRMVYPYNLLNEKHMQIKIADQTLRDWIHESGERGTLRPIAKDSWVWEVMDKHLVAVNQACGEAGILVAWRPERPKKRVRKLP
ncbi:hypothetical protein ACM1RC_19225 [Paenibacillus azoreducens]|uniref:hypothetical protein n=1 Tax=Paenibacillus azoreducens TaxID=116718 RepID=UPI0039F5771B